MEVPDRVTKRQRIFAVCLASALLATGCASRSGSAAAQSPAARAIRSPADLLVAVAGQGTRKFSLPALAAGRSRATLKMTCHGSGTATVINASGGLVLHIAGCSGRAVYGVSWTSTSKDKTLKLMADARCSWQLAVWAEQKQHQR
jgi:hypothetical protein